MRGMVVVESDAAAPTPTATAASRAAVDL